MANRWNERYKNVPLSLFGVRFSDKWTSDVVFIYRGTTGQRGAEVIEVEFRCDYYTDSKWVNKPLPFYSDVESLAGLGMLVLKIVADDVQVYEFISRRDLEDADADERWRARVSNSVVRRRKQQGKNAYKNKSYSQRISPRQKDH